MNFTAFSTRGDASVAPLDTTGSNSSIGSWLSKGLKAITGTAAVTTAVSYGATTAAASSFLASAITAAATVALPFTAGVFGAGTVGWAVKSIYDHYTSNDGSEMEEITKIIRSQSGVVTKADEPKKDL